LVVLSAAIYLMYKSRWQQAYKTVAHMLQSGKPLCLVALAFYPEYLDNLRDVIKKIADITEIHSLALVLNNSNISLNERTTNFQDLCQFFYCVRHDNTGLEFGGYQAGLDLLRRNILSNFNLIILNDARAVHYTLFKEDIRAFLRKLFEDRPNRVVGHVESTNPEIRIDDFKSSKWVRSNLIGFDHHALAAIDHKIYLPYLNGYIVDAPRVEVFFSEHLGFETKSKISRWLFETKAHAWYGAAALTQDNCSAFALKARSILQEYHLSMRLDRNNVTFLDPELSRRELIVKTLKARSWRVLHRMGFHLKPKRASHFDTRGT
jgi:hypothetical protein